MSHYTLYNAQESFSMNYIATFMFKKSFNDSLWYYFTSKKSVRDWRGSPVDNILFFEKC